MEHDTQQFLGDGFNLILKELEDYRRIGSVEFFRHLVDAVNENRMVLLDTPRFPLIWGDDKHDSVLCPNCSTDLMGGFELADSCETQMVQCPHCGQPVDTNKAVTAAEFEALRQGNEKIRLFVDIDGTMAKWKAVEFYEELLKPGFYLNMEPNYNLIDALNIVSHKYANEIELFSLSAYLEDAGLAMYEKQVWLENCAGFIPKDHQLFCLCGTDKSLCVPGGIRSSDVLLDDYTVNLTSWSKHARGVKVLNGINDTSGTWEGERLDLSQPAEILANQIHQLAVLPAPGGEVCE